MNGPKIHLHLSRQVPLARLALEHQSKEIRLMGLKLTHLVSTTAASRETAARHGLLERIDINEFVNDEREPTHA